jgi:signal transduction histidine kinase
MAMANTLNTQDETRTHLRIREIRRVERIFIYHRWLYAVAVALIAFLYRPTPLIAVVGLILWLCITNVAAWYLSQRLGTVFRQTMLSLGMLLVDALASWVLMLLFISQPAAVIYAIFTLIIIEGAVRFSFIGSLMCGVFFIMGLSAAWILRVVWLDMDFDYQAYVFWVGLVTLMSIMVGMAIREGRKQRAYAESLAMERTRLLERRRISNELHDTVLKSLQGLALEAHTLSKTAGRNRQYPIEEKARYIEEVCNGMSLEIRGVVLDMRDEESYGASGMDATLRLLAEGWSKESGIALELSLAGDLPPMPHKLAHDLKRIVGEALSNIQRHSGATHVRLILAYSDEQLLLEINDNGHGFNYIGDDLYAFVKTGRLGLVSMKERVETAGGVFSLASTEAGTHIRAAIPLKRLPQAEDERL